MGVISEEFFPTPYSVVMKMIEPYGYNLNKRSVLEPSAGDGAILDAIQHKCRGSKKLLYAIESNHDLQYTLQGKGYRVIADDFLSYKPVHDFGFIIMNPPFSKGDEHLLKAWEIMRDGHIACLLNAETIRNPYTQRRKLLEKIISQHGSVEFLGQCFKGSARHTNVDVALVRLQKKEEDDRWKIDFDGYNETKEMPDFSQIVTDTAVAREDKIGAFISAWENTQKATFEFLKSYKALRFYAGVFIKPKNINEIINKGELLNTDLSETFNSIIDVTKREVWMKIINSLGMEKYMTSTLRDSFNQFCETQGAYEISRENIMKLVDFVVMNSGSLMNKAAAELFQKLTRYYSGNTNHTEGWKTNSAHKVNMRVILPNSVKAGFNWRYSADYGGIFEDIDKVMCWLSATNYNELMRTDWDDKNEFDEKDCSLKGAIRKITYGDSSWHESKFFRVRCYKKGTAHIEFKDEKLWARFNTAVNEGKLILGF